MHNGVFRVLFIASCLLLVALSKESSSGDPKLLLISFDGFRYDLLNQSMVPNIHAWANQNTWFVNGSRSQYISFTAPNHMGIVTGLYEETHGIVSNYFYDTATNKSFDYFNTTQKAGVVNASLQVEWFRGEPIWISNERGGGSRLSSTYFWPMGEANFPSTPSQGHYHKQWTSYGNLSSWMSDCDEIIDEFTREHDPVNFVAWYIAEPDHTLHTNGFFNGALKKKVTELDQLFRYFLDKLTDRGLDGKVNVILTADHGHAEIIDQKHIMCIRDFLPEGNYFFGDHMIYPNDEAQALDIFNRLTEAVEKHKFDVKIHLKKNFPQRYHYQNSSRIGTVIIEPAIGSSISFSCKSSELERDYGENGAFKFNSSTHGMDPDRPEMRAMLVMAGPDIATRTKISDIPGNIDLYPLMCHLLNVTPSPNNGTLSVVKRALRSVGEIVDRRINQNIVTDNLGFLIFFLPPFIIVILYLSCGCRHTILKDDPGWALKQNGYRPLDLDGEMGGDLGRSSSRPLGAEEISMSALLQGDNSSLESI